MILVDNNILSTFARVGAVQMLFSLFPRTQLGITPAARSELLEAIAQGCVWLEQVGTLVDSGRLRLIPLTANELRAMQALPDSFGLGERESIAACRARRCAFLTNDRRARNFCLQSAIEAYDLVGLLRALWESGLRSKRFVRQLADRMEAAEGMVIGNKEAIFRK